MTRAVRLAWGSPAPADLFDHIHPMEDEVTIYGFRTNGDYSQTLSWHVDDDGRVHCLHLPEGCCGECVEADSRLLRRRGTVVVVRPGAQFPHAPAPTAVTVTWSHEGSTFDAESQSIDAALAKVRALLLDGVERVSVANA